MRGPSRLYPIFLFIRLTELPVKWGTTTTKTFAMRTLRDPFLWVSFWLT